MLRTLLLLLLASTTCYLKAQDDPPNILLIIADDLGVDRLSTYHTSGLLATTPTLDSLANVGIVFENVFAAPVCTPTRAAIMSGKYGVKTGVLGVPGNLDLTHTSLFEALEEGTENSYNDALIGKWHLTQPLDPTAPMDHGIDYYMGLLGPAPTSYYDWARTENGVTSQSTEYVTTALTDAAIDWVGTQTDDPWLLWLAHAAPHSPFHVPPAGTFTINPTTGRVRRYIAMVESMDFQINRLLNSLSPATRDNTLVIFVGDNGTPNNVMQDYPDGRGKGSLYQGGVRVPMIVAGKGVDRAGVREAAMIHVTDIFATILEAGGVEMNGGRFNSLSFLHLLSDTPAAAPTRDYNYSEVNNNDNTGWTIRDERYKLIDFDGGGQEMYDLLADSFELNDLLLGELSPELTALKTDLENEADRIRTDWSCRDHIQNGEETNIDCGTETCGPCLTSVREEHEVKQLRIYPNPARDHCWIEAEEVIESLLVYDSNGRLLRRLNGVESDALKIDIPATWPRFLLVYVKTARGEYRASVIR